MKTLVEEMQSIRRMMVNEAAGQEVPKVTIPFVFPFIKEFEDYKEIGEMASLLTKLLGKKINAKEFGEDAKGLYYMGIFWPDGYKLTNAGIRQVARESGLKISFYAGEKF